MRGAVRRAELEQQLKSGRIKEPIGLIWDGRHFRQDARIALLDASPERPLAVVYFDLNDVSVWNSISHDTGTAAITRYLEILADLTPEKGDAYRLSGGADEVVVLLPRTDLETAFEWTRRVLLALARETVADLTLRAAAGVVFATDPGEVVDALKARADAEQSRAKMASRAGEGRPSFIAWAGGLRSP
jgi:GGDEF domain-containing protein